MKVQVRYLSKSGNTKKIADAIARASGCKAESIEHGIEEETDLLFLGAAVYAAGIDSQMKEFINHLDHKVKKVVVFSTAAVLPSAYPQMKKILMQNNIAVDEQEFHCRGKFAMMHSGRPNASDIQAAEKFAKTVIG